MHIFGRREGPAAALVGLQDDSGNVVGLNAQLAQRPAEALERCVRRAKTIWKRYLHEAWVEVADPFLERWYAASLLRTERPAVKGFIIRDHHVLRAPARLH